jgi:hypothetical protein
MANFEYKNFHKYWKPINVTFLEIFSSLIDPEFSYSLIKIHVISIEGIVIEATHFSKKIRANLSIFPTIEKCSMASVISLSVRNQTSNFNFNYKIFIFLPYNWFFDFKIYISDVFHKNGSNISKQINDFERSSAALENFMIRKTILNCNQT